MNLGIGVNLTTTYQPIPAVALDPDAAIAALFGSGEVGAWYDPSDSSTVWQDAAGTTPAGVGDPVGRIDDKSGNGNHATQSTSAARPVLQSSGGLYYLDFDGVDDSMSISGGISCPDDFVISVAANDQTSPGFVAAGIISSGLGGYMSIRESASTPYWATFDGVARLFEATSTSNPAVFIMSNTSDVITPRINGSAKTTYSTAFTSQNWQYIGGFTSGSARLTGFIYSAIIINRTLAAGEITDLESYLASKSGVTL